MFWTNLVKTIAKVLLVVMLILTFIAFVGAVRGSVLAGLGVLVAGVVGAFVTVSGIMMACEISTNIGAIKDHLTGTTTNSEAISFNSIAQNLGVNLNQNQSAPAQTAAPVQPAAPAQPSAPAQTETTQATQSNPVDLSK